MYTKKQPIYYFFCHISSDWNVILALNWNKNIQHLVLVCNRLIFEVDLYSFYLSFCSTCNRGRLIKKYRLVFKDIRYVFYATTTYVASQKLVWLNTSMYPPHSVLFTGTPGSFNGSLSHPYCSISLWHKVPQVLFDLQPRWGRGQKHEKGNLPLRPRRLRVSCDSKT